MKILSIRQPWAWLILHGGKDIENRNWPTKLRGQIHIHASKGVTHQEWKDAWAWVRHRFPEVWEQGCREIQAGTIDRGGIVGSVEIIDCVESSPSPWFVGRYGFVLQNPQPLSFEAMPGRLGFFTR